MSILAQFITTQPRRLQTDLLACNASLAVVEIAKGR
jgi:hypothetical protein